MLGDKFSTVDVSDATGVSGQTQAEWLRRGFIDAGVTAGGHGVPRVWSFYALMRLAVVRALLQPMGGNVATAFKAATVFTHSGQGEGPSWEDVIGDDGPAREPGMPFHPREGQTILAVGGDRVELLLIPDNAEPFAVAQAALGQPVSLTLVDIGRLFERVCAALNRDARRILDEAYGVN